MPELVAVLGVGTLVEGLFNPPVLFFFLGLAAALARSDLEVPPQVTKLLSLYLLWAIGFRGGVELAVGGIGRDGALLLGAALAMAFASPVYTFFILRARLDVFNAAAVAATYGSISAVTFLTAASFLDRVAVSYGGYMVAAMALMESPAIVAAVLLVRRHGPRDAAAPAQSWRLLLHEAFLSGPIVLLLGSLLVGLITGQRGYDAMKPLCTDLFNGVLVFFLLDMGLVAARRLKDLRDGGPFLIGFAFAVPVLNALIGIALARVIGVGPGDALLFAILCGSASYIAVPAAMRLVIPAANPGLYVPLALAVTFPFNITVGIPLYHWIIGRIW